MGLRRAILLKKQAEGTVPEHIKDMLKSGEEVGKGFSDGIMMTLATMDGDKYLSELHDKAVETAEEAEKNALAGLCSMTKDLTRAKQELLQMIEDRDSFELANDNLIEEINGLRAQLDTTERARTDGKTIIEKLVNKGRIASAQIARYEARLKEQDAEYVALAKENEQNIIKIASLEVQVLSAEKMVEWVQRNEADNCETIDQLYKKNRKLKKVLRAIKEMAKC